MEIVTVSTDLINSPHAADYFTRADRRVLIGLRACLEMLALPVPEYAKRRQPGKAPASVTLAAYHADNPVLRPIVLPERKPNATPERIAQIKADRVAAITGVTATPLFNRVFNGS